jgi:hypothetical protein
MRTEAGGTSGSLSWSATWTTAPSRSDQLVTSSSDSLGNGGSVWTKRAWPVTRLTRPDVEPDRADSHERLECDFHEVERQTGLYGDTLAAHRSRSHYDLDKIDGLIGAAAAGA